MSVGVRSREPSALSARVGMLEPLPQQQGSMTCRTPREAALLVRLNSSQQFTKPTPGMSRRSYTQMGQKSFDQPLTVLSARAPVPGPAGEAYGDGRVDPHAHAIAHRVSSRDLHGAVGNYSTFQPRRSLSRDSMKTAYSNRAKEGFKYWYMERPRPTGFGKYGIGSYKTVLGLGSAPRT